MKPQLNMQSSNVDIYGPIRSIVCISYVHMLYMLYTLITSSFTCLSHSDQQVTWPFCIILSSSDSIFLFTHINLEPFYFRPRLPPCYHFNHFSSSLLSLAFRKDDLELLWDFWMEGLLVDVGFSENCPPQSPGQNYTHFVKDLHPGLKTPPENYGSTSKNDSMSSQKCCEVPAVYFAFSNFETAQFSFLVFRKLGSGFAVKSVCRSYITKLARNALATKKCLSHIATETFNALELWM